MQPIFFSKIMSCILYLDFCYNTRYCLAKKLSAVYHTTHRKECSSGNLRWNQQYQNSRRHADHQRALLAIHVLALTLLQTAVQLQNGSLCILIFIEHAMYAGVLGSVISMNMNKILFFLLGSICLKITCYNHAQL